jgi:hypothetical protein
MVVLRVTRKVLKLLTESHEPVAKSDTALGDWYANRVVVDRQPLLLLASARSLLPILQPARDVRSLPERLPGLVANRLERLGIPSRQVAAEVAAMTPVTVAKTIDRSVLGVLVDFAKMLPHCLDPSGWDAAALGIAQAALERNPCYAGRPFDQVIFPVKTTRHLLESRWGAL